MDVKAVANTQAALEMVSTTTTTQRLQNVQESQNQRNFDQLHQQTQNAIIRKSVDAFNEKMALMNSQLRIEFDEDTGIKVVKVIDSQSKEVIRQIPSETMLKIAKYIDELTGLLFEKSV